MVRTNHTGFDRVDRTTANMLLIDLSPSAEATEHKEGV